MTVVFFEQPRPQHRLMISDSDAERLARHWGESLCQPFYFFLASFAPHQAFSLSLAA